MQHDVADLHLIAIGKRRALLNRRTVHVRPVATAEILDEIQTVPIGDLGMLPADGRVVEHNFAARMAAQNHPLAAQFDNLSGAASFNDLQNGHGYGALRRGDGAFVAKNFASRLKL